MRVARGGSGMGVFSVEGSVVGGLEGEAGLGRRGLDAVEWVVEGA